MTAIAVRRAATRPRLDRLLAAQIVAEAKSNLRVPEYVIGVVGVPILLYAMFGLPLADEITAGGTSVGAISVASMTCYGIVSLAIFTFGADVATERGKGWLRRLRATPMPMWAYFTAKMVSALVFSAVILAGTLAVAMIFGGLRFDVRQVLSLAAVLGLGTIAFAPFGFAIAYWFTPKAATAVANLIFLPLAFLSGFFFPRSQLPDALAAISPYLPTYHYGQLAWSTIGSSADYARLVDGHADPLWTNVIWVAASFVVFTVATAWGYHRDLSRDSQV